MLRIVLSVEIDTFNDFLVWRSCHALLEVPVRRRHVALLGNVGEDAACVARDRVARVALLDQLNLLRIVQLVLVLLRLCSRGFFILQFVVAPEHGGKSWRSAGKRLQAGDRAEHDGVVDLAVAVVCLQARDHGHARLLRESPRQRCVVRRPGFRVERLLAAVKKKAINAPKELRLGTQRKWFFKKGASFLGVAQDSQQKSPFSANLLCISLDKTRCLANRVHLVGKRVDQRRLVRVVELVLAADRFRSYLPMLAVQVSYDVFLARGGDSVLFRRRFEPVRRKQPGL